jgi:hypothetical protein
MVLVLSSFLMPCTFHTAVRYAFLPEINFFFCLILSPQVWPSFWTYGIEQEWPLAGEIDIIEGINGMNNNQIALHTTPGCFQARNPGQTGSTLETDCSKDQGCIVAEKKPNSFGAGFATAGGGVYAIQISASGIYSWFWSVCF